MFQQLTIFDVDPVQEEFKHGEPVRVVKTNKDMDAETYFYLQSFENRKGFIEKVIRHPSLQYEVDFNGQTGIVYHEELRRTTS